MSMQEIAISDASPGKSGDEWAIALPEYNPNFIEALKGMVPARLRRWNPQERVWVVDDSWMPAVEELLVKFFPEAEVTWYE